MFASMVGTPSFVPDFGPERFGFVRNGRVGTGVESNETPRGPLSAIPMPRRPLRPLLAVAAVAGCAAVVVAAATSGRPRLTEPPAARPASIVVSPVVDGFFAAEWKRAEISPAAEADELTVLRRASLALHGTIPSLEEIRSYEADARPDRLRLRVRKMLAEPRFADYFAERLARAWVGVEGGQFIVYRRERFTRWLAEQLRENRPYDDLVREVISADGLWTSEPAVNFVSAGYANDDLDENALTARTVRGLLGQRIDCAQCHDHPFANWKQKQFEGLAAFYGQSAISLQGVVDQPKMFEKTLELRIEDPETKEERVVAPSVPFLPECLPATGDRRDRLAAWVVDPKNERFPRATVNRVWGLLFGRPYIEPVDDLPDPGDDSSLLLDKLGAGFRESGYDLRSLIETIILSRPFRASSELPGADEKSYHEADEAWAVFPMTRLRPEQVIGAMIQSGRLRTIDQNSNLLARAIRFFREQDFVRDYGDAGDAELDDRSGTVSQALLRMNGKLSQEIFEAGPVSSAGRLSSMAEDERLVDLCFLITLTRRPTDAERQHFQPLISAAKDDARAQSTQDLLWALVNSAEFSWNH